MIDAYQAAAGILADAPKLVARAEINAREAHHVSMRDHVDERLTRMIGDRIGRSLLDHTHEGFVRSKELVAGVLIERRLECVVLTVDQHSELCAAFQYMQRMIDKLGDVEAVTRG